VDTIAGEAPAGVRVVEEARGLPEQFKGKLARQIEFDVTLATVDSDEAEGIAWIGGVGFVVARGVEDCGRAAGEATDDLGGVLAEDGGIAFLETRINRGDFAAEVAKGI